jgi:hypothetical protein
MYELYIEYASELLLRLGLVNSSGVNFDWNCCMSTEAYRAYYKKVSDIHPTITSASSYNFIVNYRENSLIEYDFNISSEELLEIYKEKYSSCTYYEICTMETINAEAVGAMIIEKNSSGDMSGDSISKIFPADFVSEASIEYIDPEDSETISDFQIKAAMKVSIEAKIEETKQQSNLS